MNRKIVYILVNLFFSSYILCSIDSFLSFGRPSGLGGSYTAVSDDIYATNPAGVAKIENLQFCGSYTNIYFTEDLYRTHFAFAIPVAYNNVLSLNFNKIGIHDVYAEEKYIFRYGVKFEDLVSCGINIRLSRFTAPGYNSALYKGAVISPNCDIGIIFHLKYLNLSLTGMNLISEKVKMLTSTIDPATIKPNIILGMAYMFPYIIITTEYHTLHSEFLTGAEISVFDRFFVRTGVNKNNFTGGIGLKIDITKNFSSRIDYSFLSHNVLGFTTDISTMFVWQK